MKTLHLNERCFHLGFADDSVITSPHDSTHSLEALEHSDGSHWVGGLYNDDYLMPLVSFQTRDASVYDSSGYSRFGVLNSYVHFHDQRWYAHHLE